MGGVRSFENHLQVGGVLPDHAVGAADVRAEGDVRAGSRVDQPEGQLRAYRGSVLGIVCVDSRVGQFDSHGGMHNVPDIYMVIISQVVGGYVHAVGVLAGIHRFAGLLAAHSHPVVQVVAEGQLQRARVHLCRIVAGVDGVQQAALHLQDPAVGVVVGLAGPEAGDGGVVRRCYRDDRVVVGAGHMLGEADESRAVPGGEVVPSPVAELQEDLVGVHRDIVGIGPLGIGGGALVKDAVV